MKLEAPCKDCVPPTRYLGCHDKCEKFQEYREKKNSLNATIRKEKEVLGLLNGYNKNKQNGFSHGIFGKS